MYKLELCQNNPSPDLVGSPLYTRGPLVACSPYKSISYNILGNTVGAIHESPENRSTPPEMSHDVRTAPSGCFVHFFTFRFCEANDCRKTGKKRGAFSTSSGARAARAHSAFLFENFFFALMVSKKKWAKDKMSYWSVPQAPPHIL